LDFPPPKSPWPIVYRKTPTRLPTIVEHEYLRVRGVIRLSNRKRKVRIRGDGKYVHLGTFPDPVEAAHAYDGAARRYRRERAKTDFPIPDKQRRAGMGRITDESYYYGENGHMKEDG
jgi:hypothetical protein